jgi:hypothetical protein
MNDRQRFLATMHYQPRDRSPICDFGFWPETIEEWYKQGLPKRIKYRDYGGAMTDVFFGMDPYGGGPGVNVGLCPGFEWKVIEDRGDHEVVQQSDGVRVLRKKYMGSIPTHEGHTLVDRQSWKEHYKWRLDPDDPRRYPEKWDEAKRIWQDKDRSNIVTLWGGSLFGWFRDWMGLEAISYVVYDDPAWFEEMVTTAGDCIVGTLSRVLKPGHVFDGCGMWEDMCYNGGPLLSPEHFKRYIVPQYKRVTGLLRSHGVDTIWVDCDGKIDELLPLWLEAGVNCMFPIEVGTWGADPVKFRKQYGKDLLMMGGFDKHILARGKEAIRAEVLRLAPLVEEGGFIGFADHRVPPDVPLENYMYYLQCVREVWGKGVNLKPIGKIRKVRQPAPVGSVVA